MKRSSRCQSTHPVWPVVVALIAVSLAACHGSSGSKPAAAGTARPAPSSIDVRVQTAAEHAIDGVAAPVDVVVVRASSGEVLAAVGRGAGLRADDAFVGRYPTGSTFKVVTAADLLEHGLTPASPARCPASVTFDGTRLDNFDGRPHTIADLADAFAQSCNTAFAILGADLSAASYATTAAELGLGVASPLGGRVFTGTVSVPKTRSERAQLASDGLATLVSPVALATVAATIDSGVLHEARLTSGAAPRASSARRLAAPVVDGLRSMMAAAVANGTAAGQGLPPGTHAKTGTAELPDGPPSRTVDAWLIGYRGDLAFAVLVVGGAQGGPVAGPIAARLLRALEG